MKNIISDSLWAHFCLFLFFIFFFLIFVSSSPFFWVIIGSFYVLLIIQCAMNIAEFEMSEQGRIVDKLNSGKYKRVDITWYQ